MNRDLDLRHADQHPFVDGEQEFQRARLAPVDLADRPGHDDGDPDGGHGGDVVYLDDPDALLEEAINLVAEARAMPMSTTVKVNRDELLELLEAAREFLPAELAAARQILRERDHYIDQARAERDDMLDQARHQASRMVERTELVRAAEDRARRIVDQARAEAREIRAQVDDYCDRKLASFENVLEKTARTVAEGRDRLAGTSPETTGTIEG